MQQYRREADIRRKADVRLGVEFGSRSLSQKGDRQEQQPQKGVPAYHPAGLARAETLRNQMRHLPNGYSQ
jgi:hypothetical protein